MALDIGKWDHVFKLDPDKPITDEGIEALCTSGTDAIVVGGSTGVTFWNTADLLARIRVHPVPCVLEISSEEAVVPGFDGYLIPLVLNTDRGDWITGHHHKALRKYGEWIDWDRMMAEGYIVLNGDSAVARLTEAVPPPDLEDVLAYARLADRLMRLPVVYLEYSGKFGNMDWVGQVRRELGQARLFYGGGIDGADKAGRAARVADTVVVGNVIYEDFSAALATVEAVKRAKADAESQSGRRE